MHLQIDAPTSAYGLFQVAFAGLDSRLSRSVVALLCCRNTRPAFAIVRWIPFGRRIEILQEAIKTVTANSLILPELQDLEQACKLAKVVSKWRNERIHCEVRFIEDQPVILDDEGKPLRIDYENCMENIHEAIRTGIAMEASVPHLVACEMDRYDLMDECS